MNGYLVVARYPADDFPLALFEHLRDADEFVATNPKPSAEIERQFNGLGGHSDNLLSYGVVGFENGRPLSHDDLDLLRELSAGITRAREHSATRHS